MTDAQVSPDEGEGMPDSIDPPPPGVTDSAATGVGAGAGLGVREPRRRSASLLKIGLDILLIGAGVFLGLLGDQWREDAQHRELAATTLRRLHAEIRVNRDAVAKVKDYHVEMKGKIDRYFDADPRQRQPSDVSLRGLQPVYFEQAAWDLAVGTQALAYVDPQLAFSLSRVYTLQRSYSAMTDQVMLAMYVRPITESLDPFLGAVRIYYGDIVVWEPRLLSIYDELLPTIDRALGQSQSPRASINPTKQ